MEIMRTADRQFADLPDYPFEPNYVDIPADGSSSDTLRMHYVDRGLPDAPPVVLLHGEPTWSYVYRHLVPCIERAGHRVLVPDLIGFGRSDKPASINDYTYDRMIEWTRSWFNSLGLKNITLVVHDWGGFIGLRLATTESRRFARIVVMNTILPIGDQAYSEAFWTWQQMARNMPVFPVGQIVNGCCLTELSPSVRAAYDAPFPTEKHKAGARALPLLVPTDPGMPGADENRASWRALRRWKKPFLTIYSDHDPVSRGTDLRFREVVPGAGGLPHTVLRSAGHILQEDRPERVAKLLTRFIRSS